MFRSTSRSLDHDVPSALKPTAKDPTAPEIRLIEPISPAGRDSSSWDTGAWDDPRTKPARQFSRPPLQAVPAEPEPTLQIDSTTFFEPETPLVRSPPRPSRTESFDTPTPHPVRPRMAPAQEPVLASARKGGRSDDYGDAVPGHVSSGSGMTPSGSDRPGPPPPSRRSDPPPPVLPPAKFEPPESVRWDSPGPAPAVPAPTDSEDSKQGRFGRKGRNKNEKSEPATATASVPPPSGKKKGEKQKKSLLKFGKLAKGAVPPAALPTPTPPPAASYARPTPTTPARPKFNPPFNYIQPGSSAGSSAPTPPATAPRTYPTTPATGAGTPKWGPPASFKPPASPSFGTWGPPQPDAPTPAPPAGPAGVQVPPVPPIAPFTSPALHTNGSGNGQQPADVPIVEAGPWPFATSILGNGNGNGNGQAHKDPELPAFIELSMFQDPTSADDIAAEGTGSVEPDTGTENTWMAEDAWPAPATPAEPVLQDPWPTSHEQAAPPIHEPWPTTPEQDNPAAPASQDSWPTSHEQVAQWAAEPASPAEPQSFQPEQPDSRAQADAWNSPDAAWPEKPRPAEQFWTDQQPSPRRSRRRSKNKEWAEEPRAEQSRPEPSRPPTPPEWADEPRLPKPVAPAATHAADPWTPEPTQQFAMEPAPDTRPADEWRPRAFELNLNEAQETVLAAAPAKLAARLKGAEKAIKVENGLAYVLVDDEGRPVLN